MGKKLIGPTCGECGEPKKNGGGLKATVKSTNHEYKGRNDNPNIYCEVAFKSVETGRGRGVCKKCRHKLISIMAAGGNHR